MSSNAIQDYGERLQGFGDCIALIDSERFFTYNDLLQTAASIQTHFYDQGAKKGDRIAISLPNGFEFACCYFACLMGGFTIVPINQALPGNEIDYILSLISPVVTVSDPADVRTDLVAEIVWHSNADDLYAIFFTSGTTSRPKGVCHTAASFLRNADAFNTMVGLDESTRMLHVMPMGYMAGFLNTLLSPLIAGGTVILAPQFSAQTAMRFWEPGIEHEANAVWLSPTMAEVLARLVRDDAIIDWVKTHLRNVFVGTAALPPSTQKKFEETFGTECFESYGMSEVMLVSSNTNQRTRKPGCVGRILPDIQIEARLDDGTTVEDGSGELWIRSPYCLKHYMLADGAISNPAVQDWLPSGDLGFVDREGDLFISGRKKDLIIHGGVNVSPTAVEAVLLGLPGVKQAAVVGVPDNFWGEAVVACVVPDHEGSVDHRALTDVCRARLNSDAVPTRIVEFASLPVSSVGKIQKDQLRKLL